MNMKYEFTSKPDKCPVCNSTTIIEIKYGHFPLEDLDRIIKENNAVWGGCLYSSSSPKWYCESCETEFFKIKE